MKTDSTVDMASAVEPKTRVSSRVQTASKTRPEAPERKKQAEYEGGHAARKASDRLAAANQSNTEATLAPGRRVVRE